MTVVEHLEELRRRLLISLVAVGVTSIVGFVFNQRILAFLVDPYCQAVASLPPSAQPPGNLRCSLATFEPTGPFLTFLKIGFFTGFLIALPIVLYQVWRFITPGLTKRERRLSIPFVLSSMVLFAGGTVFAFAILPRGLTFLLSFAGDNLIPFPSADRYISFLIFLILAFGLSFEFPLLLVFLAMADVITGQQMRNWRRYVYFGAVVFAAVATPTQDPYTMLLMWIPLVLLYEGAILIVRLLKR
ncbi:MAG TPA: twin-arginine translocase subunit TatC [Actinomycetota bacterium]|nr:twin-arginine translocase subunit TatC [Actinomycetota bacterium]